MTQYRQIHIPQITPVAKMMLIVMGSCFVLQILLKMAGPSLIEFLALVPAKFLSGHIYQLATFFLTPQNVFNAFFGGLIIWFFGSELESLWGRQRFLQFFGATVLGQGLIYLLIVVLFFEGSPLMYYPLSGPSGFASALCVAYGVLFPERPMFFLFFNVKGKWFAILIVAMSLLQGLSSQYGAYAWAQLGAMGSAVGWMWVVSHSRWKKGLSKTPQSKNKKRSAGKSHLRIVEDKDEDKRTYH